MVPASLEHPAVDAILSTATFHWVADHDALFRNLATVTRPGGTWFTSESSPPAAQASS